MRTMHTRLALAALGASAAWIATACGGAASDGAPRGSHSAARTERGVGSERLRDCGLLEAWLDEAMRAAPPDDLRFAANVERLLEMSDELQRTADALEQQLDTLPRPLAIALQRFLRATRFLNSEVASLAVTKRRAEMDRSSVPTGLPAHTDRVFALAQRWRELERRSTLAQCRDDGSRDQSAVWQASVIALVGELGEPVRACYDAARAQFPGESVAVMEIKVHLDERGRVELAGPTSMHPRAHLAFELAHCIVERLERMIFPPPTGRAILVIPFEPFRLP